MRNSIINNQTIIKNANQVKTRETSNKFNATAVETGSENFNLKVLEKLVTWLFETFTEILNLMSCYLELKLTYQYHSAFCWHARVNWKVHELNIRSVSEWLFQCTNNICTSKSHHLSELYFAKARKTITECTVHLSVSRALRLVLK